VAHGAGDAGQEGQPDHQTGRFRGHPHHIEGDGLLALGVVANEADVGVVLQQAEL
jgi:hypothetical protein